MTMKDLIPFVMSDVVVYNSIAELSQSPSAHAHAHTHGEGNDADADVDTAAALT